MIRVLALLTLVAGCSAVTPRLDESTGTTLAQRCVDYRTSMLALEAAGEAHGDAYGLLKAFVIANCPVEVPAAP